MRDSSGRSARRWMMKNRSSLDQDPEILDPSIASNIEKCTVACNASFRELLAIPGERKGRSLLNHVQDQATCLLWKRPNDEDPICVHTPLPWNAIHHENQRNAVDSVRQSDRHSAGPATYSFRSPREKISSLQTTDNIITSR